MIMLDDPAVPKGTEIRFVADHGLGPGGPAATGHASVAASCSQSSAGGSLEPAASNQAPSASMIEPGLRRDRGKGGCW